MANAPFQIRAISRALGALSNFFQGIVGLPLRYIAAVVISIIYLTSVSFVSYVFSFDWLIFSYVDIYSFTQFSWSMFIFWIVSFILSRSIIFLVFPMLAHILERLSETKVFGFLDFIYQITYRDIFDFVYEKVFGARPIGNNFAFTNTLERKIDGLAAAYALAFLIFCLTYCGLFYGFCLFFSSIFGIWSIFYIDFSYRSKVSSQNNTGQLSLVSVPGLVTDFLTRGIPTAILLIAILVGVFRAFWVLDQSELTLETTAKPFAGVPFLRTETGFFAFERTSRSIRFLPWSEISAIVITDPVPTD